MTYISEELRRKVAERAEYRCEYCHLHVDNAYFSHEIDHIYAEKHGGKTFEANLCLACADCNRYKSSDLCSLDPLTDEVVALYHPRRQSWSDHFRLHEDGMIEPLSANGRATARILWLNDPETVDERRRLIKLGEF